KLGVRVHTAKPDRWDPDKFLTALPEKLPEGNDLFTQAAGREGGAPATAGPPRINRERVLDTCGSCHARRSELSKGYQVGDQFLDHFRLEIPNESDIFYIDGQIREEDYEYTSFLSSRMYLVGVRCVHCHEPHTGKIRKQGNDLCLSCHKGKIDPKTHSKHDITQPGGQCVSCHMPLTTYMQRDPRHDHGFTIPDPLLTKEAGIPNACNRCHVDKSTDWALDATERLWGERMNRNTRQRALILSRLKRGDHTAIEPALKRFDDESSPLWRATTLSLLSPWAADRRDVADKLAETLTSQSPLVRSRAARALEPWTSTSAGVLSRSRLERFVSGIAPLIDDPVRAVRVEAAWALRLLPPPGADPAAQPKFWIDGTRAETDLQTYLAGAADQPGGLLQRGTYYFERGQTAKALEYFRRAVEWNPTAAGYHHSLSVALSASGSPREAVKAMRRAHELEPENGSLAYSLALALAEIESFEEAEEKLVLATKLTPGFARAWFNLAQLRWQEGNLDGARESITEAERLEPGNPEFLDTHSALLRAQGDDALADEYAERARSARERLQRALNE
ncbi:MAG: tetratricopeptide repeat protein, partial [Planctomycetota bacterium]